MSGLNVNIILYSLYFLYSMIVFIALITLTI